MPVDFVYQGEVLPLFIAPRKVRRSRCMCLLFLFLIAAFVGLAPIMVYRSLGVPLPEKLKGYRNVQPWMIGSQLDAIDGPTPNESSSQTSWSSRWQAQNPTTRSNVIVIPKAHLHPPIPARISTSIPPPDPSIFTHPSIP